MKFKAEKINILSNIYKVVLLDEVVSSDQTILFGEISYRDREIRIKVKEPCPDPLITLIHEIIHGCCNEGGIDLDESNVNRLGNILTDTLIRNGLIE